MQYNKTQVRRQVLCFTPISIVFEMKLGLLGYISSCFRTCQYISDMICMLPFQFVQRRIFMPLLTCVIEERTLAGSAQVAY